MQNLDNEYWDRLQQLEKLTDRLTREIQENDLPDQLNSPESDEDGLRVNNFANRIYDLGCDITDLSEKLMVGRGVQENYNDKREDDIINPFINKDNYLWVYLTEQKLNGTFLWSRMNPGILVCISMNESLSPL